MIDPLQKMAVVSTVLAMVLTILLAPIFSALYRRRITRLMARSSGVKSMAIADREASSSATRPPPLLVDASDELGETSLKADNPLEQATRRTRRALVIAYCVAGSAHLMVLVAAFLLSQADLLARVGGSARTSMVGIALVVLALPTLLAVLHLIAASRIRQLMIAVGIVILIYVVLGDFRALALTVFQLHLLVPMAVYALFNLRFWRGVAPLIFIIMMIASIGWMLAVSAWTVLELNSDWLWVTRLAGFMTGAAIGLVLLRSLGRHYQAGGISDQEIFLDTWYLIFTISQTVIFVLTSRSIVFLATLLAFPLYFSIKRTVLKLLLDRATKAPPRLLLLRVFGYGQRTERLFDEFTLPWRAVGCIELIAGHDLALRNIEPSDFAAFLSGRLAARYISDPSQIEVGTPKGPDTAAPDGRYPLRQFYCLADTWQAVMRSRVRHCDLVLMDLRGFTQDHGGCRAELAHLAIASPDKPVAFLVEGKTDLALLTQITGTPVRASVPLAEQAWFLLVDKPQHPIDGSRVFECVIQRLDARATRL
jgi:hypothetical protein